MTDDENQQNSDAFKLVADHAWAWFSLHASQRMQLINYFLIAVAFTTAGWSSLMAAGRAPMAGFVAAGGAFISLAFGRLDRRTRELVRVAEPALKQVEERLMKDSGITDLDFVDAIERPHKRLSSYGLVVRLLTAVTTALFALAATYSVIEAAL